MAVLPYMISITFSLMVGRIRNLPLAVNVSWWNGRDSEYCWKFVMTFAFLYGQEIVATMTLLYM